MKLDLAFLKTAALLRSHFRGRVPKLPPEGLHPRKILMVSIAGIGDAIFCLPVLKALQKELPEIPITFVTRRGFVRLFQAVFQQEFPGIQIFPYHRGIRCFWRLSQDLRRENYTVGFFFLDDALRIHLLAFLAGIPYLFSMDSSAPEDLLSSKPEFEHPDAVYQRLKLVEVALRRRLPRLPVHFHPDANQVEALSEQLKKKLSAERLFGLVPGAARDYKCWPLKNFLELGRKILKRYPEAGLVILGSAKEQKLGAEFERNLGRRTISLCGAVGLEELPYYLKTLEILITNDTGPLHLAVLVKTPTVSLYVPTNPEGTGPMQDHHLHRVIHKDRPCGEGCRTKHCSLSPSCMELISVEEVWQEVQRVCDSYFTM